MRSFEPLIFSQQGSWRGPGAITPKCSLKKERETLKDWRPSFKYLSKWYVYFDPFRKKSQEGP